jgi:hypothetical protein
MQRVFVRRTLRFGDLGEIKEKLRKRKHGKHPSKPNERRSAFHSSRAVPLSRTQDFGSKLNESQLMRALLTSPFSSIYSPDYAGLSESLLIQTETRT